MDLCESEVSLVYKSEFQDSCVAKRTEFRAAPNYPNTDIQHPSVSLALHIPGTIYFQFSFFSKPSFKIFLLCSSQDRCWGHFLIPINDGSIQRPRKP